MTQLSKVVVAATRRRASSSLNLRSNATRVYGSNASIASGRTPASISAAVASPLPHERSRIRTGGTESVARGEAAEEEGAEDGRSASSKNKSGRARTHRKSASRTPRSCGFEYVAPEST